MKSFSFFIIFLSTLLTNDIRKTKKLKFYRLKILKNKSLNSKKGKKDN